MKRLSIRARILLVTLVPGLLLAGLLGILFGQTRIEDLNQALTERGTSLAKDLAWAAEYGAIAGNREILASLGRAALSDRDVVGVRIIDADGSPLVTVGRPPRRSPTTLVFEAPIVPEAVPVGDFPEADPSARNPGPLGLVRIMLSRQRTLNRQRRIVLTSLVLSLSLLGLAVLAAMGIGHSVARPIENLARAMERIRQGHLDTRVPQDSPTELGILERGLNEMVAALENAQAGLQAQVDAATGELRRTLEALEQQNAELDQARRQALQASRERMEFLANMSHEIRTPMTGLLGFTDLLLRTDLNDKQLDYVNTIRKSATNLLVLVNDVLDLSRIESGRLHIEEVPFDLREALEDSLDLMAPLAHRKHLELILLVYSDVPIHLMGDSNRIRQIVLNLVGNAIKFTQQGHVAVRVMLEDESSHSDEVVLRITVSDTGTGLTRDQMEGLFEAYHQAAAGATRHFGGTGLGLFISRSLVQQMGGEIGVESEPGKGSTFWFTLRCRRQPDSGQLPAPDFSGRRALVYDAHPLARLATRHTLTAWSIQVTATGELEELFRLFTGMEPAPDFVLLGLGTGETDPDYVRPILERLGSRDSCLVLLASTVDSDRLQQLCRLGADACVAKPPRQDRLVQALQRAAGAHRARVQQLHEHQRPHRVTRPHLQGRHILVAEDNDINRRLIRLQLESTGAEITTATDGRQALETAMARPFDLIVMDLHMPGLDGLEVTRRIRTQEGPNRHSPIVALTADNFSIEPEELKRQGFDDCIIKPATEYRIWNMAARHAGTGRSPVIHLQPAGESGPRDKVMVELRRRFLAELPDYQDAMGRALEGQDWPRLREQAHRLHGAAAVCGFEPLAEAAGAVEQAVHRGDEAGIRTACEQCLQRLSQAAS